MESKMTKRFVWLGLDLLLMIVLIWLDQFTKKLAILHLKGKDAYVLWKSVFELDYLENRGSAFGMFQNKKIFLLIIGLFLMSLVLYLLIRLPFNRRFLPMHVMLSFLAAGGIGNMIDRFFQGYVVDFFSFVLIHYPIFNVADIYIVASAILIGILFLFVYQEKELDFLWPKHVKEQDKV